MKFAHRYFYFSNIGNIKVDKNSTFSDELVEAEEVEVDLEVVEEVRNNHTFGLLVFVPLRYNHTETLDGVGGGVHGLLVIVCGGSLFSTCF